LKIVGTANLLLQARRTIKYIRRTYALAGARGWCISFLHPCFEITEAPRGFTLHEWLAMAAKLEVHVREYLVPAEAFTISGARLALMLPIWVWLRSEISKMQWHPVALDFSSRTLRHR
jgi:hypothetical protein